MVYPSDSHFDLRYRVAPASPEAHLFLVELIIAPIRKRPKPQTLTLQMPAWIPGSYMIRDFARNLVRIGAEDADGAPLALIKRDKQTWELAVSSAGRDASVHIRYQIYAGELSVRAAHLDTTHAFFNGASLFLMVRELANRPCLVDLEPPAGNDYVDWRVATSLEPLGAKPQGFGTYRADDYFDLIDHPVEMGCFALVPFTVRGVPHAMAISGRHRAEGGRLARDLRRICEQHAALFSELPIDRYLFLTMAVGSGYGGLEHRFSSSLICTRNDLPSVDEPTVPSDGYRRFLGLCSHEYFHLWNVKRIRPEKFADGGLDAEVHTRQLWVFEGITSYYDELALVRSGTITATAYLQLLAETITRVMRNPGRQVQTLAESSFDAWTKFYKQDENAPNAIVSYYAKGALVALALDLIIRRDTRGDLSLDHLMRALWARHGRTGIGVAEDGVERMASEITGLYLDGFFAQALDSTEDLDLHDLLATVGVVMRLRPQCGPKDMGGCVARFDPPTLEPTLGVRLGAASGDAVVQNVISGSAAERAGISPGDLIVAVDGLRASGENLDQLVARAGTEVAVHLFRRDELMVRMAQPQRPPSDTCELMLSDPVPGSIARGRDAWLGGER